MQQRVTVSAWRMPPNPSHRSKGSGGPIPRYVALVPATVLLGAGLHRGLHRARSSRTTARPATQRLAGVWKKDSQLSGSLDETAHLFELSFAARQGAKLAKTLVIEDGEDTVTTKTKV